MPQPIRYDRAPQPGLVSIVTPCRSSERFIGETLASIGAQTYPHWELWVVEDGSTGPTEAIVRDFALRHPANRVEYRRNDRSYGASHSRNVAFRAARGEFVALVDSDDLWTPDHLEAAVKALADPEVDVVYSTVLMFEDQTGRLLGLLGPEPEEVRVFPQSLFGRNFVVPSATVMRRDVLAAAGEWDTSHRYCEDFGFWLAAVGAGKRFRHLGGLHCLYRKGRIGATTTKMAGTLTEFAEIGERHVYARLPGTRERACRKLVQAAYKVASHCHRRGDPAVDPSADPALGPWLTLRAWRVYPKRVRLLGRFVMQWLEAAAQGRRTDPSRPPAAAPPIAAPPGPARRAA